MSEAIQRYRPIDQDYDEDNPVVLFHAVTRSSWGEPAEITACVIDRCCPLCGKTRQDGFDLGIEQGQVFGARCPIESGGCGWSFGRETSENPQAEDRVQVRRRVRAKKGRKPRTRMGQTVPVKRCVAEVPCMVPCEASPVLQPV